MKKSDHVRLKTSPESSSFTRWILLPILSLSTLSACATQAVRLEGGGDCRRSASGGSSSSSSNGADGVANNDLSDSGADLLGIPLEVNRWF
jgi:hypothetical protein